MHSDKLSFSNSSVYLGNDEWYSGLMYAKRPGEKYYKQMINTDERVEFARYVSATDTLVEVLIRDGLTVVRITPEVSSKLVVRRTDNTYGTMAYKYDYSASQEHTFCVAV